MSNQVDNLAGNRCQSLIGPAGCGKTETIAQALKIAEGRQLILTHTHAGVRSLQQKFKKLKIPPSKYVLETIHGFFLKYAASYPTMSGLSFSTNKNDIWSKIIPAFTSLLETKFIKQVLQCSYDGVFVDEYQDCTLSQHNAILKMCEYLPVRVLGDPLQGIFDFNPMDQIVEWRRDVLPNFPQLDELQTPWRWDGKNKKLSQWITSLRENIQAGQPINLDQPKGVITWKQLNHKDINQERLLSSQCISAVPTDQTFVAIEQYPNEAHKFARCQGGRLQSMEEMACNELFKTLIKFENHQSSELVLEVVRFIKKCTVMNGYLEDVERQSNNKKYNFLKIDNSTIREIIRSIFYTHEYSSIAQLIDFTLLTKGKDVFRQELMKEMSKSLKEFCNCGFDSISDAAWEVRSRTRERGQNIPRMIVSRTLLIKGLEFDNTLVLNADNIQNEKLFYVSMTRACHSLTVFSESPIIKFESK
jgi:DNA helicase-2/ATP-dependent DNA helicase PcrA